MEHKIANPNKPTDSLIFEKETGCDLFVRNGEWFVSGDITAEEAESFIEAHNPTPPAPPTVAEKLASVGLLIDDLKAALGV